MRYIFLDNSGVRWFADMLGEMKMSSVTDKLEGLFLTHPVNTSK